MRTKNPLHKLNKKEAFWRHHLECWVQTNATQAHYCINNELSQSDFSKWKNKLKVSLPRRKQRKSSRIQEKASRCSFCGYKENEVRTLFYGKRDDIAICDDCLWWKSSKLRVTDKMYKRVPRDECLICFEKIETEEKSERISICENCLDKRIAKFLRSNPQRIPCNTQCACCNEDVFSLDRFLRVGKEQNHVLCFQCIETIHTKASRHL